MSLIRAVWFDVGEVLINETHEYGTWADWLGIPQHTFSAVFGAVIARGQDYRKVFNYFDPGFDLDAQRQARLDAGLGEYLNGNNLYPDVRPCLRTLQDLGYFVGIAGNQTTRAGRFLRELNLPCDVLATSDDWGPPNRTGPFLPSSSRSAATGLTRSPMSATVSTTTCSPPPPQACAPSLSSAAPGATSPMNPAPQPSKSTP